MTSWCAMAALLQKAVVTATEVSCRKAMALTRSVADNPVMRSSSAVRRPHFSAVVMAETSEDASGSMRHDTGMESLICFFFASAATCQDILDTREYDK